MLGRHRELVVARGLEDVDGEPRVRVLPARGDRARRRGGHARAVRGGVVQERLVHAQEPSAGRRDVRRRRRREPAHELGDRGLDLAPEQEPAVPRERLADPVGELADDAEVHVADRVAREHEDVRRVQVGVEEAEHEHLVEHVPVEAAHDPVEVVTGGRELVEVRLVAVPLGDHHLDQRDPVDQLGGEHAGRRVVAVDAGDALEPVAARVVVELRGLAGLDEVVDLVGGPAGELVDDLAAPRRPEQVASSRAARSRAYMSWMSAWRISRMRGRWTLTATGSPLRSVARWTWPIDADANALASNVANTTSGSAPSSLRMIARTSS